MGKTRGGLREGRRNHPGPTGEHPGRAPRHRVLLEEHHRDALRERRHHHRDRHVSAGAHNDVGPHAAEQPPRAHRRPSHLGGGTSDAACAADIDAADIEGLERDPGRFHEPLCDAVPAADHGHLVVRATASESERDRQGRRQVTPSSPPSDQRAHDLLSPAVDPGRRC